MYKEIVSCIIVIVLIVIGHVITQNNITKTVEQMENNLNNLRQELQKENASKSRTQIEMEKVNKTWKEKYETMAYYIEHDELEKVESELAKLNADIETEEYSMGVENLENCKFILSHIKDKNALKIVNLF